MALKASFFIVAILVVGVWLLIEVKRMKHKLFAIFLIALILFTYIGFSAAIRGQNIDFTTASGLSKAGGLYLSWLGALFGNLKSITTYAFQQDWKHSNVTEDEKEINSSEDVWAKL